MKRVELAAFLHVLRHGLAPICYWTDHEPIVDALQREPIRCCAASRAHVDMRRLIGHYIHDFGGVGDDGVMARHDKAHRSKAEIDKFPPDCKHRALANRTVDGLAKQGTEGDNDGMGPARQVAIRRTEGWITASLEYIVDLAVRVGDWEDVTKIVKHRPNNRLHVGRQIKRPHQLKYDVGNHCWCCRKTPNLRRERCFEQTEECT